MGLGPPGVGNDVGGETADDYAAAGAGRGRIARDAGATLSVVQFTAVGALLVPAQLAAAVAGLHLVGALR